MIIFYHIKDHTKKDQIMYMNDFPKSIKSGCVPLLQDYHWNEMSNGINT